MSTASEAADRQLAAPAQLAGAGRGQFKSDYLPLDKMATPEMIAAIQGDSTPVDPNKPSIHAGRRRRAGARRPRGTAPPRRRAATRRGR